MVPNPQAQQSRTSSVPDISGHLILDQNKIVQKPQKKTSKICHQCGKTIIGTLVRAMDQTYHIDCFRCYDCGEKCSNKFFAADIEVNGEKIQAPLCEYDYFKRIDLICTTCDKAIRGSYITAVGRKYHPEHFYCELCHKVFDSEDYYEHGNKIYCHYHYSRLYASHCEACKSAILKQYVEMYRGGREQQWHPECFMVHKFWGVSVTVDCIGMHDLNLDSYQGKIKENGELDDSDTITPNELFDVERKLERMTMTIWLTLSEFEEACASCISDMLHSASTGNQLIGLLTTGKLVLKLECLFNGIDVLQDFAYSSRIELDYSSNHKLSPLLKEPRSMSSKIMSYLTFLRDTDKNKMSSSKFSQQLLSLISTLAHYIKLISRTALIQALEYNKISRSMVTTDKYLREIALHSSIPDDVFPVLNIAQNAKDLCFFCDQSIEEECFQFNDKRWHDNCLKCSNCSKPLASSNLNEISFNSNSNKVLCASCSAEDVDSTRGFKHVSKYSQLIYLMKIALVRSRYAMQKRGTIAAPQTTSARSAPSSAAQYSENEKLLVSAVASSSLSDDPYTQSVSDIKRMRSMRQNQKIGSATNEARRSIILEAPQASSAGTEEVDESNGANKKYLPSSSATKFLKKEKSLGRKGSKRLRIEDVPMKSKPQNTNLDVTSTLLKNEKGLTLDDIPRIVSSEQAREHRPNAFKFQKRTYTSSSATIPASKPVRTKTQDSYHHYGSSGANSIVSSNAGSRDASVRFSELSKSDHEFMRHIAAFSLHRLMKDTLSLEDCISFINIRKAPTFWEKITGGGTKKNSQDSRTVFGAPLEELCKKYGVDSDLGIGPQKLRIPIFVDELINVMHTMDLSVEGVFRINGNIRKLKMLSEEIDKHPDRAPDFSNETPIQLAALLKKFSREMPDPLLTFKLYDLFILSQKLGDDIKKRDRILKLAYCMLPKAHRDLTEVLFLFFNWVSSFCHIDEETGSKMDIHNLATVLTPNILYLKPKTNAKDIHANSADLAPQGENHFLAIEVINTMIEFHDEFSIVPEDLWEMFELGGFSKCPCDLTTKEILMKCNDVVANKKE
ncbi:hypothetical protein CANARDRAFT_201538 [[Candida] arabinofermentans NRRL YB-2248]|uniref:Uncharacterized protein n=1 Tax=[Candida] arabinofermentans NRRL YB-2248 TaxID=983967 RepID=A0A1E4SXM9_9ASCO|nr:hypothetical protein CANARDRAFT_201538 [[Candida] arabinofermentans NRRL YB-2248]